MGRKAAKRVAATHRSRPDLKVTGVEPGQLLAKASSAFLGKRGHLPQDLDGTERCLGSEFPQHCRQPGGVDPTSRVSAEEIPVEIRPCDKGLKTEILLGIEIGEMVRDGRRQRLRRRQHRSLHIGDDEIEIAHGLDPTIERVRPKTFGIQESHVVSR